jgi:glycerophosphoryl diester phosphodiesterase
MAYQPLASKAGRIHVCAHRGHSAAAPENTLPALEAAAAHGATVAEIDIVLTRDDRIVVLHDEILDRTTDGNGRVAALDFAEIKRLDAGAWFSPAFTGTRIPSLEEALATARLNRIGLLIEIKERQRPEILIECLARLLVAKNALDDVLVISFDHVSLVRLKDRLPAIRTELITPAMWIRGHGRGRGRVGCNRMGHVRRGGCHRVAQRCRDTVAIPNPERLALRRNMDSMMSCICRTPCRQRIDILAGDDGVFESWLARSSGSIELPDGNLRLSTSTVLGRWLSFSPPARRCSVSTGFPFSIF